MLLSPDRDTYIPLAASRIVLMIRRCSSRSVFVCCFNLCIFSIQLVHYTAQEYFNTHPEHFSDAEQEIAETCLTYLLFNDFKDGYCSTDKALETLLQKNPLLDYAARYWAHHVHTLTVPVMEMALKFLADASRTALSFQVINLSPYRYSGYSQGPSKHVSGLHLCAYFGMHSIVIKMPEIQSNIENVDVKDSRGKTPLSYAAERGHEAIVKLLHKYIN